MSRDDLPVAKLVLRHRGKQGQENAFKGPHTDLDLHHPAVPRLPGEPGVLRAGLDRAGSAAAVQFTALPKRARKHGLRPVIRHVMRTAYMVRSGRRLCVRFGKTNFRQLPARLAVRGDDPNRGHPSTCSRWSKHRSATTR